MSIFSSKKQDNLSTCFLQCQLADYENIRLNTSDTFCTELRENEFMCVRVLLLLY